MRSYVTESHESDMGGTRVSIVNRTPVLRPDEREEVKRSVERQLYEVFSKYVAQEGRAEGAALIFCREGDRDGTL